MNDTDLHERFAAAVAAPAADRIDLAAVLRGGRRRHRIRVAATVGSVVGVLALVGALGLGLFPRGAEYHVEPAVQTSSASTAPATPKQVLAVACSSDGITVSADAIAAQPTGVVLRVSSTLPKGAYLTYGGARVLNGIGVSGGDELPQSPETWTKPFPPGPLQLSCAMGGEVIPGTDTTVRVTDPGGYFSPTTLEDIGCSPMGEGDWISGLDGSGATREDAVAGVVAAFVPLGVALTVEPVSLGYTGASEQWWLAKRDGTPYLTIRTWVRADGFHAYPDQMCPRGTGLGSP